MASKRKKNFKKTASARKRIYLDYAASTPVDPRVAHEMGAYQSRIFGNPSALYEEGVAAKKAVESARARIAKVLRAEPDEIIFTSGGTEGNALAIMGIMDEEGGHVVTTSIEHSSVFESCRALEKRGVAVTYVPSRGNGIVDSRAVAAAIRPDTRLVSIMYANNEIGTVQPIREIAKIVRAMRASGGSPYPLLHTDACQAGGALDISMPRLGVDLATFNGSKLYGPKGVGFFYKKRGVTLTPLMRGGGQERGVRGGTENVPGIVGVAEALEIAENKREREVTRLMKLRDYFLDTVLEKISGTHINGDRMNRLPGNANITFDGVSGEALVIALDALGIAAGTGSACASAATAGRQGGLDPSHVILALGESEAYARSSVRFSLGRSTTKRDLDYVIKVLMDIVRQFRRGIL